MMSKSYTVALSALFILTLWILNAVADSLTVKMSTSGICHDATSGSYTRTKNYTPYETIESCLAAGGRLTKAQSHQYDAAEREAIEQERDFVSLYNRDDWQHWIDHDGDCQNTRHELLLVKSLKPVKYKTSKGCQIIEGEWYDPYSGETFHDSKQLDLDHIVPLQFAHNRGGHTWSAERKRIFANAPENLILVKASLNRQKGAKGPTDWMPPNHVYRCKYLAKFDAVMVKYELDYIPSEKRVIDRMLNACAQ